MTPSASTARARFLAMFALVAAGEMIFALPFHVPRYFRASLLATFGLSNAALGDIFAVYGVTAMLSYFPGGALADRLPARGLLCLSLLATALGGVYLATLPGSTGLAWLYGYWGVTTILLFWAAMIRATREWGGSRAQGRAFGILDGGRGLAAAAFATLGVWCFSHYAGGGALDAVLDADARRRAMRAVIVYYTLATVISALLVWRWVPRVTDEHTLRPRFQIAELFEVLRMKAVWLQAVVVVAAYCGYKGLDNYALYAHQVLGFSETAAAGLGAASAYIRPLAALGAGLIADRIGIARSVLLMFATLIVVYGLLGVIAPAATTLYVIYGNLFVSCAAVFALRGVYFALLQESAVPTRLTGAAVGLVSLVGYTPDIFFAAIAGRLLDAAPGAAGHQHYFILLALIAIIGVIAAGLLLRRRAVATTA
jgi:nitrate/nitrite transporter NarK